MMPVKICGITRGEDAMAAAELGADALGFIFFRGSPRCIEPAAAREIINGLPPAVVRVGVFVNERIDRVRRIVTECRLDMVQLHGDEAPGYARSFPESMVIKSCSPRSDEDIRQALRYPARCLLADSRTAGSYGGTGQKADWESAGTIASERLLVLAGGLGLHTLVEAMNQVKPAAVDINSGIETAPGVKDRGAMRQIMALITESGRVCRGADFGMPFVRRR